MSFELSIALRHLASRKKWTLSLVTWLSVAGVALGVTALVGGFSLTSGFESAFRDKVMAVTSHVFVREYGLRFAGYREVEKEILTLKSVKGVSPITFNEAMLTGPSGTAGAVVKGIEPHKARKVLAIGDFVTEGGLDELERGPDAAVPGIVLGAELARVLGVNFGGLVTLVSPYKVADQQRWSAQDRVPATKTFRVAGIFKAGFHEYDARLAYINLGLSQSLFGRGATILGLEVRVDEPLKAGQVAGEIRSRLGVKRFSVLDWRRQNRNLFASLTYQRIAILVVLSVMVLLASCNVACMLIMLVLERTREIAILKAMGVRDSSILLIFVLQGLAIGLFGTLIGAVGAYALCEVLLTQGISLDPKVYGIARIPVMHQLSDYVMAICGAMIITFLATIAPALRGARLKPVDGLRALQG